MTLLRNLITPPGMHAQARVKMRHVAAFWINCTLSRAWNSWRNAVVGWNEKQQRTAKAVLWWSNRALAKSWGSWLQLVGGARESEAAAMAHLVPRLQARYLLGWRDWKEGRWAKGERLYGCRERLAASKKLRMLQVRAPREGR